MVLLRVSRKGCDAAQLLFGPFFESPIQRLPHRLRQCGDAAVRRRANDFCARKVILRNLSHSGDHDDEAAMKAIDPRNCVA
jgi:hypothetical protein